MKKNILKKVQKIIKIFIIKNNFITINESV